MDSHWSLWLAPNAVREGPRPAAGGVRREHFKLTSLVRFLAPHPPGAVWGLLLEEEMHPQNLRVFIAASYRLAAPASHTDLKMQTPNEGPQLWQSRPAGIYDSVSAFPNAPCVLSGTQPCPLHDDCACLRMGCRAEPHCPVQVWKGHPGWASTDRDSEGARQRGQTGAREAGTTTHWF